MMHTIHVPWYDACLYLIIHLRRFWAKMPGAYIEKTGWL